MSSDEAMVENQNQNQPQPEPSSSLSSNRDEPTESERLSNIWNHFKRVKTIEGKWAANCNYCGHDYSTGGGGGDDDEENLYCHLHDHPEAFDDDAGEEICSAREAFRPGCYFYDEEVTRKELALMIICHGYPISIVDDVGFRRFSNSLQPRFKLDRRTVEKDILKLYNDERSKTMKLLCRIKSRVAISAVMWSSSDQDKHYMAIRAHFIDDSMTLRSRMLRFVYVPVPHTGDAISDVLVVFEGLEPGYKAIYLDS